MVRSIYDDTLVTVLAGGRGSRLHELTDACAKPALPFAGHYRIVDFVLSNALNSGLSRIGVITQYQSYSLIQYINSLAQSGAFGGREVEVWPADQRAGARWYAGTGDALFRNLDIISRKAPKHVLVLAADHVYRMDYRRLIDSHFMRGADVTVGCVEQPSTASRHFGIMAVDESQRITAFREKPRDPAELVTSDGGVLASMGIYLFNTDALVEALAEDAERSESSHDFGHDIIPALIGSRQRLVAAYSFRDPAKNRPAYWRDIGTIDSYWRAHMDLVETDPPCTLAEADWPLYTAAADRPPPRMLVDPRSGEPSVTINAIVSEGCVLQGGLLRDSVLFPDVRCGGDSVLDQCVVLPGARIGRGCRLTRAVVDQDSVIPDGTVIGHEREADRRRFRVSESGVVLVAGNAVAGTRRTRPHEISSEQPHAALQGRA